MRFGEGLAAATRNPLPIRSLALPLGAGFGCLAAVAAAAASEAVAGVEGVAAVAELADVVGEEADASALRPLALRILTAAARASDHLVAPGAMFGCQVVRVCGLGS